MEQLANPAPAPCGGGYADGFAPVAERFAAQLADGSELGAGFAVYHRGRCVVDLWGGRADVAGDRPWARDTRTVVFSVTKGLAAMALTMLADRGVLDWDAPVAAAWPGFAAAGKDAITIRTLVDHRAGLLGLDQPLTLDDCVRPERKERVVRALEQQRPAWAPGTRQGYHAITWGMYARELFERLTGDDLGGFLRRELFTPLGADVDLGTPAEVDDRIATLYPPSNGARLGHMLRAALGRSTEGRLARAVLRPGSWPRAAFLNPKTGPAGIAVYDTIPVRRAALAWASATASAHGLARAYVPFASGGVGFGRTYVDAATLTPLRARESWAERDLVLQRPMGWTRGFVKEDAGVFSPHGEAFGHPGMGGALGWCDPVRELAIGYVMNRLDWRVRSPRALALCRALYACAPVAAPTT
ncbi:MAG: beta-lactamase family protein [Myxococcales bacterium]|nr:beta-lactamase family protein [Myxococcales bacterium]